MQALANTRFRVQIEGGHIVTAHVAGRMRKNFIRIVPGDRAVGGKLVGAGGGGFLLFYAPEPNRLRRAMEGKGLRELRFGFDQSGTRILET